MLSDLTTRSSTDRDHLTSMSVIITAPALLETDECLWVPELGHRS